MSFQVKIPDNVKHGVHKLPHVQPEGRGYVLHHPAGIDLHLSQEPGTNLVNCTATVDEAVVKAEFEKSIAETAKLLG